MFQYLTHHYLIDLVAGGSLACAFFYYYLSRMPDDLRHPTNPTPVYTHDRTNSIPLDPEANGGGDMDWGIAHEVDGLMRDNSVDLEGRGRSGSLSYAGLSGKQ